MKKKLREVLRYFVSTLIEQSNLGTSMLPSPEGDSETDLALMVSPQHPLNDPDLSWAIRTGPDQN
ncbi:hypothetical protein E2C01_019720 [Portunus trituberculatus]|uniref:Uncharacterized protein n=1 Tax=Portunus trituberculatus TaxID=210409 RepID=A0A5B7DZR3_PORTR|nr:hypothetical protein [Portunus trituberculatus]